MNALSLKAVVSGALADVGVDEKAFPATRGRPRDTVWFTMESGFGMRRYASGRNVYIVQSRMNGRVRTITIGPSSLLTQAMASSSDDLPAPLAPHTQAVCSPRKSRAATR